MTRRLVRMGPKGQVVIPKPIRDQIGLEPGDEVLVEGGDGEARVRRPADLGELRGLLKDGASTADLEAEHRRELEREEDRLPRASR